MASESIIRGNGPRDGLPDYIVRWLRRDKIGVFSGLVERHYKVGPKNQRIDPLWLEPALAPQPWGLPCVDAVAEIGDALCIVGYRYEGSGGAEPGEDSVTYELDMSMAEKPIQTHPSFKSLKEDYAWDDAERRFAEFLPEQTGGSGLVFGNDRWSHALSAKKKSGRNPLFGTESWFSCSAIFRVTYARTNVPPSSLRGLGTIISSPPGIAQFRIPTSGKRNWLKLCPKLLKRGNLAQITDQYALSHPGGWKRPVYSAGQLEEEPGED
jgi:hypothetical protein